MKIQGPSQTGATSKTKKADKAEKADGGFDDFIAAGAKGPSAASATQSIAKVDGLLAVQGAEDPTERAARGRMHRRASTLLDELDRVRGALLQGTLTLGHCIDIADVVASHREKIADPKLTAILDEIDLRAQVEIAKIRRAMDQ
jgi:hypothetical protein